MRGFRPLTRTRTKTAAKMRAECVRDRGNKARVTKLAKDAGSLTMMRYQVWKGGKKKSNGKKKSKR